MVNDDVDRFKRHLNLVDDQLDRLPKDIDPDPTTDFAKSIKNLPLKPKNALESVNKDSNALISRYAQRRRTQLTSPTTIRQRISNQIFNIDDVDRSIVDDDDDIVLPMDSSMRPPSSSSPYSSLSFRSNVRLANKMANLNAKQWSNYLLPEEIERFEINDDLKKKFELIRQDYCDCLNELSEENENICEELDQTIRDRNYLQGKIELLREEYLSNLRKNREQWFCERSKLEQKINDLESLIQKLSYQQRSSWATSNRSHWIGDSDTDVLNDNDTLHNLIINEKSFTESYHLHQLANKISELALALSEIISNLRQSEIEYMIVSSKLFDEQQRKTHRIVSNEEEDDDEVGDGEEKIRFLQEQLNRSKLKRDLLEHLLAKLKDDLRNVNKTLDLQQHHQNHHNHHRKQQHQQQYLVEQQASPELILEQQRKALRALRTNDAEPYESFI
ncbi:serine proteinase stubble-like [Sarcoptes scabiei]|nr:serine proteinase stubble-like [Sarcoptes scabiei]